MNAAGDERGRVLALLARHGWNATSFQVLEEGFRYWFDGDDACIAYVDTGRAWVAAGAPIAAVERLGTTALRFAAAGASCGRRVSFFATERRFVPPPGLRALLIGEQPVWDPREWPQVVAGNRSLREQLRRAERKQVVVRALSPEQIADPRAPLRAAIDRLMARWSASRPMAPMSFLVAVQPFGFARERRWFIAERAGAVVGFLAAVPVYARQGWLLEDLLRDPAAPNGTAELLIDRAMRSLGAEGSTYLTLGLAPLAGPVSRPLGLARDWMAALYDFRGVRSFRAKLQPSAWDPIYLLYADRGRPAAVASTAALLDALAAFARGNLARFAVETLLRGPALVVRALALLLVPWTVWLALLDPGRFPDRGVQLAWVGFDLALIAALLALASRWRRWLALALAVAVTTDAALTAVEVLLYHLPRARDPAELVGLAVATIAPSVAAVILWKGLGHHRRTEQPAD